MKNTSVRVMCPACEQDVVCAVQKIRLFHEDGANKMLVLFECPTCESPHIQTVSPKHLPVLVSIGVSIACRPDEMNDKHRWEESESIQWNDVLDFVLDLQMTDYLADEE